MLTVPWRFLVSVVFALSLSSLPAVQVAACSCAMGETEAQINAAQLAFVGTVVDQRETGAPNGIGDAMVEYAFEIERASGPTSGLTIVAAGSGGASCGITFANGEKWLVILPGRSDMGDTHLCAGNLRMTDLDAAQRSEIEALLTSTPTLEPREQSSDALPGSMIALIVGGGAMLLLLGAGLLALRRSVR